ncbi:Uncharacterized protein TCM_006146 [Theobroma cacao]|uniref:Uncharacterized protein n=1 Tax=Theobroma cacao TaxID=3641 RepID=A0A061DY60_THECC|nr:Uncharacterized protein TCM_006146 [Theobroma cacao]
MGITWEIQVRDLGPVVGSQRTLMDDESSKREGPCELPHIPISLDKNPSQPNMDFLFPSPNCQREQQYR